MKPRVALIGAGGHGVSHQRTLQRLSSEGRIVIAGYCDRQPLSPPVPDVPFFMDAGGMLTAVRPDVVVICTPPHTHLPIALACLQAGADLLLEKPPVMSLDEHRQLSAAVASSGRLCQVGFQALGSAALSRLLSEDLSGDIGVSGAWWRPDTYYARAPWAGRRAVDGRPVFDGALVNPFAHALMQALVLAGPEFRPAALSSGSPALDSLSPDSLSPDSFSRDSLSWGSLFLERYRTRDIETDDTTFLRVVGADGRQITLAVTLASAVFLAGEIQVGGAALEYPTDRLRLPGSASAVVPGRIGLLENLLDHRDDPSVELLAPLERTEIFTAIAEAIVGSSPPVAIGEQWLVPHPEGGGRVVPGIETLVQEVAATGRLPSELGVPWSSPPFRLSLPSSTERNSRAQASCH